MTDITEKMTTGATGFGSKWLATTQIKGVHPVVNSDRGEFLLHLLDGRVIGVSCDPIVRDEEGVPFLPDDPRRGAKWEVYLCDATDTEAGKLIKKENQ